MLKIRLKAVGVYLVLIVAIVSGFVPQSASAGEFLSVTDREFLDQLTDEYLILERLGGGVILSVNGTRYGVNRIDLGKASRYFQTLFTSGMSDSRVAAPDINQVQTVSLKPIEIPEIHEDVFAKMLRLVFKNEFDPFDPVQDQDGSLTFELIRNLERFDLGKYVPKVMSFQEIRDRSTFERAVNILSGNEEILSSKFVEEDLTTKIKTFALIQGKAHGNCKGVRTHILNCLSDEYLQARIPALKALLDPVTSTRQIACPEGYIRVPGNPTYGGRDFCVMKYEASNPGNGQAASVIGAQPWVNINRAAASAACRANGPGFELISNAQWMTIARDIESNAENWNGGNGPVGTGTLSRGNSNLWQVLAAAGDENPYFGLPANQQNDWTYRRTHVLSNGEVIWDLAGNVSEWVLDNLTTERHDWQEFTSAHFAAETDAKNLYAPLGNYNSAQNVGQAYMSDAGAALRGGDGSERRGSGVFAVLLGTSAAETGEIMGFRCAFVPAE